MNLEHKIIQKAEFNPKIKVYILLTVGLVLLVSFIGIPLLIVWFLGFGQYVGKRFYENLSCQLTTRHLEYKKGVLFKVEKTIPLENIQDLTFIQNPLLNLFDLRILKIETAGNSNPRGTDMKLIGILNTSDFKKKVLEQRELLKVGGQSENNTHNTDTETNELLTEIRDLLKDIKNK
ncbi:PH domain-containing protein [Vicingaceae bacterium]|jgi:putative membrane protein|nr:PH domain-containing protein [Vicingaceae bacterium]